MRWIPHWESTMEPSVFGLYRQWDISWYKTSIKKGTIVSTMKGCYDSYEMNHLENPGIHHFIIHKLRMTCWCGSHYCDDPTKLSSGWSPIELYNHDLTQVTWNDMIILGCIKCSWVDSSQSQTLGNAVSTTFWDEITCETLMPLVTHYTHCMNAALNFTSHNPT
jgi:hypothetical protein